ncbi:hypothetical protein AAT17_06170 [Nonlabens sp. MIC269]|uniref:hypothetical protein n=1 Tax=Nonlabens sp. MIC269 TaxID=1476901 RepID=UPI000721EA7A|nr:hypothetical protein [Nonlabens sp. MIC269]ALM20840.1 hypothetical protein AAT17_06170 [Nonlabens sp. MIC269]
MKKIGISLIVAAAMVACNNEKKNTEELVEDAGNEMQQAYNDIGDVSRENVSYTENEAESMAQDMKTNVQVMDDGSVNISNFTAYGELQNQVKNLSTSPNVRDEMNSENAYQAFQTFVEEMPAYLKTNVIMKEVDDVEKAMKKLVADLEDESTKESTIKDHIEDIQEAVEDLNDEIVDARLRFDGYEDEELANYADFVSNVNYDDEGVITIVDFNDYETVKTDRMNMMNAQEDQKITYAQTLVTDFNSMLNNMPEYLKVDDVMDAVEDVQKEMKEYQDEKATATLDENLENLEEIDEALYDLNKEMLKARKKYDENRRDAIEEYLEELNDTDEPMSQRLKEAREEYNEEMND